MTLYSQFRGAIARQTISVGPDGEKWIFYDAGPKKTAPLVCLHGTSGSADVFYRQVISLTSRGYRVIAAQYPAYDSVTSWVRGFDRFLDVLETGKVHLLGTSLGGYLTLNYIKRFPLRVHSLVLCNAFCDTSIFNQNAPCLNAFKYLPEFYLKKYILDNFPQGELEHRIAGAVDFVVTQLETLDRESLASRLTLNCMLGKITEMAEFPHEKITVLDTMDAISLPESMRDQVYRLLNGAKFAHIKSGGDFPYLSRPDEFSMLLQVHLRGSGCYPLGSEEETEVNSASSSSASVSDVKEKEAILRDMTEQEQKATNAQSVFLKRAMQQQSEDQEQERRQNLRDRLLREEAARVRAEEEEDHERREESKRKKEEDRQRRLEQRKLREEERRAQEEIEQKEREENERKRKEKKAREQTFLKELVPESEQDSKRWKVDDSLFS